MVNVLTRVEEIIPKWKIVPTKDVIDSAFKDPVKREEVKINTTSKFYHSFEFVLRSRRLEYRIAKKKRIMRLNFR